jgi:uroporphyrinogen decarboxylase
MCETTFWPETLERWHAEGLPAGVDPVEHFRLDPIACINDLFDPSFGLPERTLEQISDRRVYVDRYGKTMQEPLGTTSPPRVLTPAIQNPADWHRLRETLTVGADKLNNPAAAADYDTARAAGRFLAITPAEPLWFVLEHCCGFERGLLATRRQPDLVADMVNTYTDYVLGMLALVHDRGYRFDALWFWSDLCYKGGLLLSPTNLRQLVLVPWQRLAEFAREHGMYFMFHCDGDVRNLLPLLLDAGGQAIHPLEARAGNDVRDLKQRYGDRLCLIGNIDADIVATNDPAQIEREVAQKVPVAAAGSGYIYHIDHSVPPTISLDSYRWLIECVRRYGGVSD